MKRAIVLFDVDGTLTQPRKKAEPEMLAFLKELHEHVDIGIVGGSDLSKIQEQLGDVLTYDFIDYVFSENGLVAHGGGSLINKMSLAGYLGEDYLQEITNFCLGCLSEIKLPVKRGTFIEYRSGMLNVSPIGRSCSQKERDEFEEYDKVHKVRESIIEVLKYEFEGLTYSIGGQISFDVFPEGWDKTYCLKFLQEYSDIYFFGDKTSPGGNDYEIFSSSLVKGTTVTSPEETMAICRKLFLTAQQNA
jgi:phosphomannomutase